MNIVLLGPPGAGKGTHCARAGAHFNVPILAMSALMKEVSGGQSANARLIRDTMARGELVSDEVIWSVFTEEVSKEKYAKGVLLDGFPRTLDQAKRFSDTHFALDAVCILEVDDAVLKNRVAGRRLDPETGKVYHIDQLLGADPEVVKRLVCREDDREEVVLKRLQVYHALTAPMVAWFSEYPLFSNRCVRIDASRSLEEVWREVKGAIEASRT